MKVSKENPLSPQKQAVVERTQELKKPPRDYSLNPWLAHNESMNSFAYTFGGLYPTERAQGISEGESFQRYIEGILDPLALKAGKMTAVEFGGPGTKFFSGFEKGFFGQTFGVCLQDDKSLESAPTEGPHSVIIGNIFDSALYRKLSAGLEKKGVDFIVSRMEGGLLSVSSNTILWATTVKRWYSMLNVNGLMFVQFEINDTRYPVQNAFIVKKWIQMVRVKYPQLKIEENEKSFKIHKTPAAPTELPLLDLDQVT